MLKWFEYLNERSLYNGKGKLSGELFKKFVYIVHLEISSYCNRSCHYCPNSHLDSTRKQKMILPGEIFVQCLRELQTIHYDKFIEFNGFNEPLYDRELFLERAKQVKEYLPECTLLINSNGDCLTKEYLYEIAESGVDYLCITLHVTKEECVMTDQERQKKIDKFLTRLSGIEFDCKKYCGQAQIGKMKVLYQLSFYDKAGHNWGGSVSGSFSTHSVRNNPCFVPAKHFYVDYRGRVNLCCSVNMDNDKTDDFCIGNITENTMFDLYSGKKAARIRRSLLNVRNVPYCCKYCTAQTNYIFDTRYIHTPYDFLLE